ncbi:MAG: nucleotide exchange factor GrpE [Chlorobiales bacterium]|nr:nucleotide exchange factor GrpE [Chlorobiales bacterium]
MTKKAPDGKENYKEHLENKVQQDVPENSVPPEGNVEECEVVQESSVSRIVELEMELKKQVEQTNKFRDELLRSAADFENFRKQKEREAMMASSRTLENIIRELLPVVDDVRRVLTHAPLSSETSNETRLYIEGVELVKKNLEKWLGEKGVRAIESKGMMLDVNFHEAISQVDQPGAEPDTIIEEYQTGYLLGDKVIRHAKVIVAR